MPRLLRSRLGALPLLLALVLSLPACDSGDGEASDDRILFGVNYTRLFAAPTAGEVQAVRADWAARATASSNASVVASTTVDGATVSVVRHTVTAAGGGSVTHYGVVRVPAGAQNLPALVVHHGGDNGFAISATTSNTGVRQFAAVFQGLAGSTVQVWPVYRSETLSTTGFPDLGGPYTADGDESPWDYDVDDAIALLDAVQGLDAFAASLDDTRAAAIGFSRGGNTAALHAVRDPAVTALVDYYGPTDFFNDDAQLLATGVLTGNPGALGLPGAQFLFDNVLNPLRNADGTYNADADYADARLSVVRRSASAFEADLPNTQVHHHVLDGVVPVGFSRAFAAAAEGGAGGSFEAFFYGTEGGARGGQYHAPEGTDEMRASIPRVESFLTAQFGAGAAVRRPALAL